MIIALTAAKVYSKKITKNQIIDTPKVQIIHPLYSSMVSVEDILNTLHEKTECCFERNQQEINTFMLEETLNQHPHIAHTEVFSSLNGALHIVAKLRTPVARVFSDNQAYYLDQQGDSMPLSKRYSAPVILITGSANAWERTKLMTLLAAIEGNSFLQERIVGVHIDEDGTVYLHPSQMNFRIRLGRGQEIEQRLFNLEVFWKNALSTERAEKIKTVDIQYKNQVVCQY
jgi:cell division protein FtsQ